MALTWNESQNRLDTGNGGYIDYNTGLRHYADGSTEKESQYYLNLWKDQAQARASGQQAPLSTADYGGAMAYPTTTNDWYAGATDSSGGTGWGQQNTRGNQTVNTNTFTQGGMGSQNPIAQKPGVNWVGGQQPTGQKPGVNWGGGNSGGSGGGYGQSYGPGENPYLRQMGDWLTSQMTQNFQEKVMPAMNSGAMASGSFGGSRHGVVEANAQNDLQSQIGGALTNLYGQGYNTGLQYDLGIRGNELGYANLDRQINNDNLNWQLQGANFGLGLYDRINNNYGGMYGVGNTIQNQPLNYWSQFSNAANSLGNGFNTGAQSASANPLMGAMGGMQAGQALGNYWNSGNNWGSGWAGGGSNPNVAGDAYMPAYQGTTGFSFK